MGVATNEISLIKATVYNIITKFSSMFIQLFISMILARLVAPDAYGMIAIVTVLLNFFNIFPELGIGIAVIQRRWLEKEHYNMLFSFSFYMGIVLVVIILVIAYPVSLVYKDKVYIILCIMIAGGAFFNTINTVPNAILIRNKRFDIIALRTIVTNLLSGILAIALALLGFGVYALIWQSIITAVMLFVWNFLCYKLKYTSQIDWNTVKKILGSYSLYQILFGILNYFTRNLDSMFVGAFMGNQSLGYYNKAYSLNLYPNALFTSAVTGVLHPYLREYEHDANAMYDKMLQIVKPLSILGIYVTIISFWGSKEIVLILFGKQWYGAITCFHLLSVSIWSQMLNSVCGSVFLGLGRTDQTFKCGIFNVIVITFAVLIGTKYNDLSVLALSIGLGYILIMLFTYYVLIKKTLNVKLYPFMKLIGRDFLPILIFLMLSPKIDIIIDNIILSLVCKVLLAVVYYIVYLLITNDYQIMKHYLQTVFSQKNVKE